MAWQWTMTTFNEIHYEWIEIFFSAIINQYCGGNVFKVLTIASQNAVANIISFLRSKWIRMYNFCIKFSIIYDRGYVKQYARQPNNRKKYIADIWVLFISALLLIYFIDFNSDYVSPTMNKATWRNKKLAVARGVQTTNLSLIFIHASSGRVSYTLCMCGWESFVNCNCTQVHSLIYVYIYGIYMVYIYVYVYIGLIGT